MKFFVKPIIATLTIFLCSLSLFSKASDLNVVDEFIKLSDKTKVVGATQSDIDAVAELLSEKMRYQHPSYNADLSKAEFIDGLIRYMGSAESLSTKIINRITGNQAVVIAYVSTTTIAGKAEVDPKPLMRLIEFSDDKIVLVKEYW